MRSLLRLRRNREDPHECTHEQQKRAEEAARDGGEDDSAATSATEARIGDVEHETLEATVEAAKAGDTITVDGDDSMTLTDILLIVILILVMCIIVALTLFRS